MIPGGPSDQALVGIEVSVLTALVVAAGLIMLLNTLRASRPELRIGRPIAIAVGVRIVVAGGLSLTSQAAALRGGDEYTFKALSSSLARLPLDSAEWTESLTQTLHIFVFSVQRRFLDSPDLALRITEAGLAVCGLVLMATAVYDLAGPRAARVAAWLLAFEPAGVFFAGVLHKEPLMTLAEGLVVYGGARMWKDGRLIAVCPMAAGCLIAVATRPYAGWFLIAASAAIILHSSFRVAKERSFNALGLALLLFVIAVATVPTVLDATSPTELKTLQASQDANVTDAEANLALERVDYSTRGAVITNLPKRVRDVLLRPYPWQVANVNQQLGLAGTITVLVTLAMLFGTFVNGGGRVMARAGPLVYTAMFMLVAYSLSAGNAGTAFRYRTHIIALALCLIAAVRVRSETEPLPGAVAEEEPGRRPARVRDAFAGGRATA